MSTFLAVLWAGVAMADTNVKVGETAVIDGVSVKVVAVRPYRDDATPEHRKATVSIEVGKGEAFDLGQYGEESVYWQNHLLSLQSSTAGSAMIRVAPFTFTLDVSAFDPKTARAPVIIGKPFTLHDLMITVKALGHVREYGSYFTLPVDIEHEGRKVSFNQGSFNYLGYVFSLSAKGVESALLEVRPVRLGEKFEIVAGTTLEVLADDTLVKIELVGVEDPRGQHQVEYDFRFGPKREPKKLIVPFTEPRIEVPEGKRYSPPRDYKAASLTWHGLTLQLGAGSTDGFEVRRGPFQLTRSTK